MTGERPPTDADAAPAASECARYDAIPAAPPPPPFERMLAAATAPRRFPLGRAVAALLLCGTALGAWLLFGRSRDGGAPEGAGERVTWTARLPRERRLRDGSRVVLDAGAEAVAEGRRVTLLRGRAFFDVARDGTPFAVATPLGDVEVTGTAFEVDLTQRDLVVSVESGVVRAAGVELRAGQRLRNGSAGPLEAPVGSWFRLPLLSLSTSPSARLGQPVAFVLAIENPTDMTLRIEPPAAGTAALWISVTGPDGGTSDVPVETDDLALAKGATLELGPRQRVETTVRLRGPFGPPGAYRGRALLRAEGRPPVLSAPVALEVR